MTAERSHREGLDSDATLRQNSVEEFVVLAKGLFDLKGARWGDPVWDVTQWCRSRAKVVRWRFLDDGGEPMEGGFADVAKAAFVYQVRVNAVGPATLINWLVPLRSLYRVVVHHPDSPSLPVQLEGLTLRDWQAAEDEVVRKASPNSRYLYAGNLQSFAGLIESRGIVPRTQYRHRQKRSRDIGVRHIEDRDAAMDKLPPEDALRALADAAQRPENDRDLMLFSVVKLLVALGFRIGEALTLPADCWRMNARGRPYLTYWPEKGGPLSPKWIPSTATELIREAVETLLSLSEEARQRARLLEADPARVPLLGDYRPHELLDTGTLSEALRMERSGVRKYLARLGIPPTTRRGGANGKGWLWRVDELERALATALPEHRYELVLPTGGRQRLSEFLCLIPKTPRNGQPSLLTVRPLPASAVENFVATVEGRHGKSVFERYGLKNGEGKPWSMSTHQFRHWINTVATKGGLSDMELARWMGRKDARQNRSYQHLDQEERIERTKDAVRSGNMVGTMSEVYRRLPADDRELFLDGQVEAANVTPYGVCTHNFAVKPCPYHVQCLTGCNSFLRTKGDRREIVAIVEIKRRAERNIEAAERAAQGGVLEAANWVDHQRRLLDGADKALAVEEDQGSPPGTKVEVFPEGPNLGNAKRSGRR